MKIVSCIFGLFIAASVVSATIEASYYYQQQNCTGIPKYVFGSFESKCQVRKEPSKAACVPASFGNYSTVRTICSNGTALPTAEKVSLAVKEIYQDSQCNGNASYFEVALADNTCYASRNQSGIVTYNKATCDESGMPTYRECSDSRCSNCTIVYNASGGCDELENGRFGVRARCIVKNKETPPYPGSANRIGIVSSTLLYIIVIAMIAFII